MGGASLGDLYTKISNANALATVERAFELGIVMFDTAPWYGLGLSEARVGLALHDKPRNTYVLNTKVGRFLVPNRTSHPRDVGWAGGHRNEVCFDYCGTAITRQHEDCLQRLGTGSVDSLVIHDLEPLNFPDANGAPSVENAKRELAKLLDLDTGGFKRLEEMREAGEIQAFGAGVNAAERGECPKAKAEWNRHYVEVLLAQSRRKTMAADAPRAGLDFLLLANMYSLLNWTALETGILDACQAAGVSVVVGGPFSSGILATGADPGEGHTVYYNYQPADSDVLEHTRRIEAVCAQYSVPLVAAALQFPLGHPAVVCVIPGAKSVAEVESNVDCMNWDIPMSFWDALKAESLIPRNAPVPG
jgi:D-threo-aldose 1-dehydrogenase